MRWWQRIALEFYEKMSEQTKSTHEEKVLRIRALEVNDFRSISNPKFWRNYPEENGGNNSSDIAALLEAVKINNCQCFEIGGRYSCRGSLQRVYYDTKDYPRSSADAHFPGLHPDGIWKTFEEFRVEGYPEEYRLAIDTTRTYKRDILHSPKGLGVLKTS